MLRRGIRKARSRACRFSSRNSIEAQNRPPSKHKSPGVTKKLRNGWSYGSIKDADKKEHPCLVAWEQLPVEQRAKDHLFNAIVRAFWIAEQESTG